MTRAGSPPPEAVVGTLAVSTITTAVVVLPAFQLGSLGTLLRDEFAMNESVLGGIIAVFFLSSAVSAPVSGRVADAIGAKRALLAGMLGSTISLLGVAVSIELWQLIAVLVVGGVANGLVQPAANLALSGAGQRSRGLMFGIKQSGVPLSTLLVGLMVPGAALAFGWRWAFGLSAAFALGVIVLVAVTRFDESGARANRGERMPARIRPLIALAIAAALGIAAATSLGAFTVESAVANGVDIGLAGWLLAVGSIAGASARLLVGWQADRAWASPITLMALLLGVGVVGYVVLAFVSGPLLILLGVVVGYAFGWGWNGLLMYSVVLIQPHAPAAASGIAQVGMSTGAALGPLGFGAIVSLSGGYALAWMGAAVCATVAALILLLVVRPRAAGAMTPPSVPQPR